MKIRVAYVIGSLDLGGAERQLLGVASRLDRERFEPRIYCLSHLGAQAGGARLAGVPVSALGLGPLPLARWVHWVVGLRRLFRSERPDLVHAFMFPSYSLAALAAAGAKLVLVAGVRSVGVGREGRWPFSMLDRAGLERAAGVFVNAQAVRAALCRRHPGVSSKVDVLPNGIDPCEYRASDRGAIRSELGFPPDARVVLMVANFHAYKGHTDALQAIGRLRKRVPTVVLVLAGSGPQETRLRRVAGALGLEKAVLFLGERLDVPRLLGAADVVLLASREEGMPNAVLEALAAARPVVATRAGGVPELLSEGVTGLLVEPGDIAGMVDALERVLTDAPLSRRLSEAGPALIADRFPWARTVHAHQELYSFLCESASALRARHPA